MAASATVLELSSLSTFWESSALTPPARRAALAAAAATLNLMLKAKLLVSQAEFAIAYVVFSCRMEGLVQLLLEERRRCRGLFSFEIETDKKTRTLLGNGHSLPRHEERKRGEKSSRRWGRGAGGELKVSAMVAVEPVHK